MTKKLLNENQTSLKAVFHLPGLFEFYELYKLFLPLFFEHRDWFYDWCEIGSIYGAPEDCLWGGGRTGVGDASAHSVLQLVNEHKISARLTFSNSLLQVRHLDDFRCNDLCRQFEHSGKGVKNGVIVHSDLLAEYLQKNYPELYLISSTTKVLTKFEDLQKELERPEFSYVVPDFRLNKSFEQLPELPLNQKSKIELLVNECCWEKCTERKACYENVSRKNLGENVSEHICKAPGGSEGYRFSKAMENPMFIGIDDILQRYLPINITNFKIEGRGLGSAMIFEFLLYYLTKPEYQLKIREKIYLDSMLDLF